jgi:1,4-alpha-glucan branching enzyme
MTENDMRFDVTLLSEQDVYLFNEGSHVRLYDKLGAHPLTREGVAGTYFAVWAPNAQQVFVMGDFNRWDRAANPLRPRGYTGIWEGFVPGVAQGAKYKYYIVSRYHGYRVEKADPFGFWHEVPPHTASVVWQLDHPWDDAEWMQTRAKRNRHDAPVSIYEMHLGSWRRVPEEGNRPLTYRELAPKLAEYLQRMGFTHVEFMPVMHYPFEGSWGYQLTGYFAPQSLFGTPEDFAFLVDTLHQAGIGVILDWVPSHFPTDQHGLAFFDGTHLFEHADPRRGFHPDWKSAIFNYGRHEVRSFLFSTALFWLDKYHIDGLRVDAVASMLYLDYSRKAGEWIPNEYGSNHNLEAISFLRRFNEEVYKNFPDTMTIAEESTDYSMVSRPTHIGGLGFGMKWDMGWMHDTLKYMKLDGIHRKFHHNTITFRMLYAFHENFVLPLSHDEVVHGKGSLYGMMAGADNWQKCANLRALFGYMFAQPGKKLLFMGNELAQWGEWNYQSSLDWHVLDHADHAGIQRWVKDLCHAYRAEPALYEHDCEPAGFEWVDCNDSENSVIAFLRKARNGKDAVLVVCNFTSLPRHDYRVGVPRGGYWKELLNSDATVYWGSGMGNYGGQEAQPAPWHNRPCSLSITLPPLSVVFFKSPNS